MKSKSGSGKEHPVRVIVTEDSVEFRNIKGDIIGRVTVDTMTEDVKEDGRWLEKETDDFFLIFTALTPDTNGKNVAIVTK